jgi:hypothetical protein
MSTDIKLRDIRWFRERFRCGTSETPPNHMGHEFEEALNEVKDSPTYGIFGSIADVTPEEVEEALDALIEERTRKK